MEETELIKPIYNIHDPTVVPVLFGGKIFDNKEKKQASKTKLNQKIKNKQCLPPQLPPQWSQSLERINNDSEAQAR